MIVGRPIYIFFKFVNKFIVIIYIYNNTYLKDFTPKKVIFTGDSAGGNLIGALTLLTIMTNTRIPDGLLFSYPVFLLDY